jgi:lipoyl(octanoyl) transferase
LKYFGIRNPFDKEMAKTKYMQMKVIYNDLGLVDYKKAWDYQERLFEEAIFLKRRDRKKIENNSEQTKNYLIFCEHPHVYTLGKNGSENNLLIDFVQLKARNAGFYKINRGGDITYHGPGQIVGYPIFDLEAFGLQIKQYITKLEESVIRTLGNYGLNGERMSNATGVWLSTKTGDQPRKICAIGVRASRYVTMHGFAFNINTNLTYFSHINPCGFINSGVTSLEKEVGYKPDIVKVKDLLKKNIADVFSMKLVNSTA